MGVNFIDMYLMSVHIIGVRRCAGAGNALNPIRQLFLCSGEIVA
jgi:hypothetical protein